MPRWFWGSLLFVLVLDQGSKHLAREFLAVDGPGLTVLPGLLFLTQVRNPGLALGGFPGARGFAVLLTLAAVVEVFSAGMVRRRQGREFAPLVALAFGLVLGGALGNALDRV